VENGGIMGRGVLLDYADWATRNNIHIEAMSSQAIMLSDLKQLVKDQNITFLPGDILFIRSGFTAAYESLSGSEQKSLAERPSPDFIGIEASKEVLRWLWENQFAAVAGDAPSFERAPIAGVHADLDVMLHQWLLGGWGIPIGELFDLERLGRALQKERKKDFLS
jgi:kynurenine formamidase